MALRQQLAGVGDQVAYLERLYQKWNVLFFQVASDFGLGKAGKCEHNVT